MSELVTAKQLFIAINPDEAEHAEATISRMALWQECADRLNTALAEASQRSETGTREAAFECPTCGPGCYEAAGSETPAPREPLFLCRYRDSDGKECGAQLWVRTKPMENGVQTGTQERYSIWSCNPCGWFRYGGDLSLADALAMQRHFLEEHEDYGTAIIVDGSPEESKFAEQSSAAASVKGAEND